KPEFRRFLYIALASNSEVRSMLYLALRLNYIDRSIFNKLIMDSEEIAKIISGLIKSLIPKS
ncbi:MAG: four helix bundle protein, partial [Pedobacter sp.]